MWPFGSKDNPPDDKADPKKVITGLHGAVPPRPNPSNNTSAGQTPGAAGSTQGAGSAVQPGPQNQQPKPPSVTFDSSSVEAIKGSFVRMANAFDELKRLNEEHKRIQENNFKLFSGEKDREIADLRKVLAGWQAAVTDRDKEITRKQQALDDSSIDLNRLNKDLFDRSEEVKRRELEIVDVRKEIATVNTSLANEQSSHNELKEAHKSLQDSETALKTKQSELVATIAERNGQVEVNLQTIDGLRREMECLRVTMSRRLAHFVPKGILESRIGPQVVAFDDDAAAGDASAISVIAGLSQLRAAFIPASGPNDKLAAVKSIGSALYAAWSTQSKDPKAIHSLFVEWQNFLNDLPGAGYQLIVPDLGQSVPQNVTPLDGATKVNEVLLWIVKAGDGGIYSKGIVR